MTLRVLRGQLKIDLRLLQLCLRGAEIDSRLFELGEQLGRRTRECAAVHVDGVGKVGARRDAEGNAALVGARPPVLVFGLSLPRSIEEEPEDVEDVPM